MKCPFAKINRDCPTEGPIGYHWPILRDEKMKIKMDGRGNQNNAKMLEPQMRRLATLKRGTHRKTASFKIEPFERSDIIVVDHPGFHRNWLPTKTVETNRQR